MKFPVATVLAVLAAPLLAYAQTSTANPFNIPTTGLTAKAGSTTELTWKPTTSGTVTISLRQGAQSNLDKGTVIASGIPNSGSYSWSVPSDLVRGSDYALEITASSGETNYSPPFVIDSSVTVASTTASSSGTMTTSGTATTGTTGTTSGTTMTGSTSGTMTTSGTTMTGSTSGSMSTSGTATSRSTASASSAGFQSTSTGSTGGAPRATAAAGFMGLVALGAMAL